MTNESERKDLESAQKNQKEHGQASSDPSSTGPAENLREKAAKLNEKDQEEEEPA